MKKSTIFFMITATVCLGLSLYNKRRATPTTVLAGQLCATAVNRLSAPLQKAILVKGALSFLGVWLLTALCKKSV